MGEAGMAQRMGIQRGEPARFRHPNVALEADWTIVPCAQGAEIVPVTLAVFPDHGKPAFVGSTISSRDVFIEAARDLTLSESQRLNNALERTMEGLLDEGSVKSDAVLKSSQPGKPDIHMLIVGNPYQDTSLRLYFHLGEFEGARVIYQDARTTKKGADKVERVLRTTGGYQTPRDWESKSSGRGGR